MFKKEKKKKEPQRGKNVLFLLYFFLQFLFAGWKGKTKCGMSYFWRVVFLFLWCAGFFVTAKIFFINAAASDCFACNLLNKKNQQQNKHLLPHYISSFSLMYFSSVNAIRSHFLLLFVVNGTFTHMKLYYKTSSIERRTVENSIHVVFCIPNKQTKQ